MEATDIAQPTKAPAPDRWSTMMARRLSPLAWERFIPSESQATNPTQLPEGEIQNKCFAVLGYLEEYYRPSAPDTTEIKDVDLSVEGASARNQETPRKKSGLEQLEKQLNDILHPALKVEEQQPKEKQHQQQVKQKLSELLAIPQVRKRFEKLFEKEWPHYSAACDPMRQVRDIDRVTGKLRRAIYKTFLNSKQQHGKLIQSSDDQIHELQKNLDVLEKQKKGIEGTVSSSTLGYLETQKLLDYKRQLREKGFVMTPSREQLIDRITREALAGKKIFLVGSTGTGKTQLAFYALNNLTNGYELINWHEGTTPRDLFGYRELWTDELGGVQSGMKPGPIPKALEKGVGVIHEEYTGGSTRTQLAAKFMLGAKPGARIQIPGFNGQMFDVTNNFIEIFTGNPKDERTKQREDMDPAILRELTGVEVSYMPSPEMNDIIRAMLIEENGVLKLSVSEAEYVQRLTKAAEMMQRIHNRDFEGFSTEMKTLLGIDAQGNTDTTLNTNFLDPGTLFKLFGEWELAASRGQNIAHYMSDKLREFVTDPKTLSTPEERRTLQKVLHTFGLITSSTSDIEATIKQQDRGYILPSEMAGKAVLSDKNPMGAGKSGERQPANNSAEVARAREILGKDFLGEEAVRTMEQKLKNIGVNVEFNLENLPPLPYSERDLEIAKQDGEMLVVRAENMHVIRGNSGGTSPTDIINFRELFRRDPLGKLGAMFYSFSPGATDWYKGEDFATKGREIKFGWALVKKEVLQGSTSKNWSQQEDILKQYADGLKQKGATSTEVRRRTAAEVVWDEMLYYVNTGEQLLPNKYDWTQTRTSGGHLVFVGYFDSRGLDVRGDRPGLPNEVIGVCPSR